MDLAPIVLFAYDRPAHVKQTLESLRKNDLAAQSDLFVYIDGPKENSSPERLKNIEAVKTIVEEVKWTKSITIVRAEKNKGLANSVMEGVSKVVKEFGKIIVIEDDVLLSPFFLQFMNDALNKYKDNTKVLSIGSWNYFCDEKLLNNNFFYRFPDSIAWATFDRAWDLLEKDGEKALNKIIEQNRLKYFNGELNYPYFSNMLQMQIDGKISSWAIRWTATSILHDKLNFFPQQSLSKHMGFGAAATHEKTEADYNEHLQVAQNKIEVKDIDVLENEVAFKQWQKFVKANFLPKKSFKEQIKRFIPKAIITILKGK
jgi:hypothetical protein